MKICFLINQTKLISRIFAVWILLLSGTFVIKGQFKPEEKFYQAESTQKMAKLLREIYDKQDFKIEPNKTAERAVYYEGLLKQNLDIRSELQVRVGLATELLRTGESRKAVEEIKILRTLIKEKGVILAPFFDKQIRELAAISNLRMGEQENCQLNHKRDSCIFPIKADGVHQLKDGSTAAADELLAILKDEPENLQAKWLLNVAKMTLGEYPEKVPTNYLIAPEKFKSDYDIGRFEDIAMDVGLDATGHAGGSIAEDFDGDGLLDIMISGQHPLDQIRFFHNNGNGSFSERTDMAGLKGIIGGLNIIHADYNNDGFADVLVLRGGWWGEYGKYPPSLLKNNGDGTFDDVTAKAGLMSFHPTQTAVWLDYDTDGFLDVFIGHESSILGKHPSQMFHNNGDGTFTETGENLGLSDLGYVKGVAAGDFNNDGRTDLYVSIKGELNRLFRNDGAIDSSKPDFAKWKFTDVAKEAGVGEPIHSFPVWFWDFNNDGWEDILVAGYYDESPNDIGAFQMNLPNKAETPRLFRNDKNGKFTDITKESKLDRVILAMGANFGDLDNDGWLDCYFGTGTPDFAALLPNKMFRNDGGKVFQDITTSGGFGHLQKGHGISFADFNNDGAEDIFEVIGGAFPGDTYQSVLFKNAGTKNHWITLDLNGEKSNRSAIGTRIKIIVNTPNGERSIYRTVSTGGSFGGSPLRQHIGLGNAVAIKEIEIKWHASGKIQKLSKINMDRFYVLNENQKNTETVPLKAFKYGDEKKDFKMMNKKHH